MRAFVFTDKSLERRAGQFVWLSINTEKTGNAGILSRFPVEAWPSFFVIDPRTEKVALRWVGGATAAQIGKILDDGRLAVRGQERGIEQMLGRADRLYGEKKNREAAQAYREVLAKAPAGWKQYARATESLLFALQSIKEPKACAETAREAFVKLAKTSSAANVAAIGLDCALDLPKDDPGRDELVAVLAADSRAVVAAPPKGIAADDVSSVYETLAHERQAAKDEEGRRQVLQAWASYLEGQAAAAGTPEGRSVFDSHRLTAYLDLNEPQRAIPMLEASERDFPDDYNPPARLALALEAMQRWGEALAASDRALAKVYGPRKISVLRNRAQIYARKGDRAAALRTVDEAITTAENFPEGQRSEKQIASLRGFREKIASFSPER